MEQAKTVNISAVLIIGEEDADIVQKSIKSVSFCREIVLVFDMDCPGSQKIQEDIQKEIEVSNEFTQNNIKIYHRALNQDFAAQRNFGLSQASKVWVFFIDADEVVSEELKTEIVNFFSSGSLEKTAGFCLHRDDYIFGKKLKYGETAHLKLIRLGKKDNGKWRGKVHEEWAIEGPISELVNPLKHYPHQAIAEFLTKINFYTDILAKSWFKEKKNIHLWQIVLFPVGKFLQNYFLRLGMLDGTAGFIMSMMMSFHSFLARSKLWLLYRNKDE